MKKYIYNLATDKTRGLFPGAVKIFLFMLSIIYGLAVRILIFISRFFKFKPDCKVISVGNITLGGTGKTTLVAYLANSLKKQGHMVVVISRGYKRNAGSQEPGADNYDNMGDEPYMLSRKLKGVPVIVDADRRRGIEKAIKDYAADTVILDDGFQQWRIKKGLEIVAIDTVNPFGNKKLLPRGILREPLSSLRRADVFVLTKTNLRADTQWLRDSLSKLNPAALIFETEHRPLAFYEISRPDDLFSVETLKGKSATLFSGIGDPESFEKLILSLGIKIGLSFKFQDHHHYGDEDLERIIKGSLDKNIDTVITTEKDAARMGALRLTNNYLRLLVLRIELKIKDEQGFNSRLLKLYSF